MALLPPSATVLGTVTTKTPTVEAPAAKPSVIKKEVPKVPKKVSQKPASKAATPKANQSVSPASTSTELPFTGMDMWLLVAVGIALISTGTYLVAKRR